MIKVFLAAGVASLAISAPAASQPGDNRAKDRGAQTQKAERGGKARAQRAERKQAVERRSNVREQRAQRTNNVRQARTQRADRSEQRAQRVDRSQQRAQRTERVRDQRVQRVDRGGDQRAQRVNQVREQRAQRVDRVREQRADRPVRVVARERQLDRMENRNDRQVLRMDERRGRQIDRIADRSDRRLARLAETRVVPLTQWNDLARGGVWVNGCPPGLATRLIPCVPPGQLRNVVGQPLSSLNDRVRLQELPSRLRYVYGDTDDYYYRYGNGYAYRVNRSNDLISALLPLFGLGLTAGQPFPSAYSNYYMPTGLQPFYANSSCDPYRNNDDYYRYANGYVYEVDCRTGLIEDVDPMLGYGYGYGQMMPATYSAYNVPYQYRSFYSDSSDNYYRYAPGAIYQVDPTTSLITAVAALLTGGMTVGQQLPMGYSAYNVPYQYRTTYFDTQNDWYRYSNGSIYQIDPRTQLVTALVAAALT